jgi:DHA1 family multidrug resistance protein-like MFS transporter
MVTREFTSYSQGPRSPTAARGTLGPVILPAAVGRRLRERTSLPRDVLVLGLIAFCVAVGFGVLVPVLPVFARTFGVGNTAVGAVISVFALMRLAVSPVCGRLIARLGERTVLATGIFVVAASSGLAGTAQTYPQLLLLRGVGGIGSAMFTVSAMSLLLGSVPPQLRGRAAGFFHGGFLLGGMAGPAIGGLLALVSIRAPFFFYAGTLAVAGIVGLLLLSRTRVANAPGHAHADAVPLRTVVADPRFQAACLSNLAQGWTSFGVRSALIPVLVVEVLHRNTTWTGIAFACAAVAQTVALAPAGRFVDTVGRRPAMIGGGLLAGASIMVVPFAPNMGVLIAALCAYGVAAALLGTAPAASVGDAAGGSRGTPVAVFSMFSDAGAIVGPIVAGLLADRFSYPWAFGLGAVLLLLAAGYAVRMPPGVPTARSSDHPDGPPVGEQQVGGPESDVPAAEEQR